MVCYDLEVEHFDINDINMLNEYTNESLQSICCMVSNGEQAAKEIMRVVIKRAGQIVMENHIITQIPEFTAQWVLAMQDFPTKCHYTEPDMQPNQQGLAEDTEPTIVDIEHWRRFQGSMGTKQHTEPIHHKQQSKAQSIIIENQKLKEKTATFNSPLVKMGTLNDDDFYDPTEESMRQAKLRQVSIQQQKEVNDKAKLQEVQEQVKQLRRLNVDTKATYTFDYEGKVIIQKLPEVDKYPKTQQNMMEKRNLIEVKDRFPNHRQLSEQIQNPNKPSFYQNNNGNFLSARGQTSQLEIITLKSGVAMFEGRNEKRNDRQDTLLSLNLSDPMVITSTLGKPNLQLTKNEYKVLTNTQSLNNMTLKKSQQILDTSHTQYNNDSILGTSKAPLQQHQYSLSSSILQQQNGSISIISEQHIEDLLYDNVPSMHMTAPMKPLVNPPPSVDLPRIPKEVEKGSVVKLPKSQFCIGTLPKILPKVPRSRLTKQALMLRIS